MSRNSNVVLKFPFYEEKGEVVHFRKAIFKTPEDIESVRPPQGEGVFGLTTLGAAPEATTLVITNDDFDAMALHQECGMPAISLSNHSSLPVHLRKKLQKFQTVYLWMKQDSVSQLLASAVIGELGAFRCVNIDKPMIKSKATSMVRVLPLFFPSSARLTVSLPPERSTSFDRRPLPEKNRLGFSGKHVEPEAKGGFQDSRI